MAGVRLFWSQITQEFPAGTEADHLVATLMGGAEPMEQDVALGASEAVFLDVAPGTYHGVVQLVDANGNDLGAPAVSGDIVVAEPPPPVMLDVPVNAQGDVTA